MHEKNTNKMTNKLDALLGGKEEKSNGKTTTEIVRTDALGEVQVSAYAHDKAFAYARLACDIHGSTIECGGYLVSPKGTTGRVAQDAYLAHEQIVGSGEYKLNPQDVIAAGRHLNQQGLKVLGWWHSHGTLDTFHSGIDDTNQMTVLNAISPFNYVNQDKITSVNGLTHLIEGDNLVSFDANNPGVRFELPLKDLKSNSLSQMRMRIKQQVGFTYSLVVNHQGSQSYPYTEMGTRVFNPADNSVIDKSAHVDLHIYPSLELTVNEDQLEEEILERVKVRRSIFYSLGTIADSLFGTPNVIPQVKGLKRRKPKNPTMSSREVIVPIGKSPKVQTPYAHSMPAPQVMTSLTAPNAPSMLEEFAKDPNDQRPIVRKKKENLQKFAAWKPQGYYGNYGVGKGVWYDKLSDELEGLNIGVND